VFLLQRVVPTTIFLSQNWNDFVICPFLWCKKEKIVMEVCRSHNVQTVVVPMADGRLLGSCLLYIILRDGKFRKKISEHL